MAFPDDVPTLTSGDVTLRAHRPDDAEGVLEQCTDPLSQRWTTVPLGYTREMADEYVRIDVSNMWASDKEWIFALECTHSDGRRRFGGSLSLRNEGSRRAEVAFGAHPDIRGRGVMTTAVHLLLDWGFAERDLETVLWLANVGNFGSRRVAWKSGFAFGGTVRRWMDHREEYPDGWIGTLHRDDSRMPKNEWYAAPRLTGPAVALRPLRRDDVPRIVEACQDDLSQQWLPVLPAPYTEADAHTYLDRTELLMANGEQVQWAVADLETDELIGNVGLPRMGSGNAEIGYWTHPQARGRGAMQEAVRLVTDHGFRAADDGGLGLHRMFVKAAADNVASQRVALAASFEQCGRERGAALHRDDRWHDVVVLEQTVADWGRRQ